MNPKAVVLLVLGLLAAGCQRTPEEPKPNPPVSSGVAPSPADGGVASFSSAAPSNRAEAREPVSSAAPARCIVPLPEASSAIPPKAKNCPKDPEPQAKLPTADLTLGDAKVVAELVTSERDTSKGLMYRVAMAEDHGMLFRLTRKVQQFWMRNTCIPLDMLFIDDDGTIVGIVENAPTLDEGVRSVDCASRYVLELNAGYARRHKIKPGQTLSLPDAIRNAP